MKNRTQLWFIGILAICIVGVLVLWPERSIAEEPVTQNESGRIDSPSPAHSSPTAQNPNKTPQELLEEVYQTPIEFYGKVVDDRGKVVPEAMVTVFVYGKLDVTKSLIASDERGLFHVKGAHGLGLGIEVSKMDFGAYPALSNGKPTSIQRFDYGLLPDKGKSYANPEKPFIFTLRSPESLRQIRYIEDKHRPLKTGETNRIALDSEDGKGTHLVSFQFHREPSLDGQNYDWSLIISVEDGGIREEPSMLNFIAPPAGYASSIKLEFKRDNPGWRQNLIQYYFIKFSDDHYARIKIDVDSASDSPLRMASWLGLEPGRQDLFYSKPKQPADQNSRESRFRDIWRK
jgi:hypothetical protein